MNHDFMEKIKKFLFIKISFSRLLLCMAAGMLITYFIYSGSHIRYSGFSDFYTGATIFINFNKLIDKFLPYIYTAVALLLYCINFEYIYETYIKHNSFIESFFEKICTQRVAFKWCICISFIIFILISYHHFLPKISDDNYHFGEILIGNVLDLNHLKLYSDYYPAHGLYDIIPSWIGIHIFDDKSIYGVLLGKYILDYVIILITILLAFIALPFYLALIGSLLTCYHWSAGLPAIYFLSMYIFITNNFFKKHFYVYSLCLCACNYLFYVINPIFGAPFILSMIIPFLYRFYEFSKNNSKKNVVLYIVVFLLINLSVLLLNKEFFLNNFNFILMNYKVNLLAFGNMGVFNISNITVNSLQYLLLPFFCLLLMDEMLQDNKKIDRIMFLSVLIMYPLFISTYSLGRFDGEGFYRVKCISSVILFFLIPVLLDRNKFKNIKICFLSIMLISCLPILKLYISYFPKKIKQVNNLIPQQTHFRNGNAVFNENHLDNLNIINDFINKNAPENYTFYDLTNQGALYFYLNKKPPIPFIAFYNIPSPKLDRIYADKLKNNLPDIVLISSYYKKKRNIIHDGLPVSLRVNHIYKTLLLSNKYILLNNEHVAILKKVKYHKFSEEEIQILNNIFGFYDLQNLPDVYGTSVESLSNRLERMNTEYTITKVNKNFVINFKKPVNGSDLDYLYFSSKSKHLSFKILINGFQMNLDSAKRKRLIPLNINPVTMLKSVNKIEIEPSEEIDNIDELIFYKKKENE